MFPSAVTISSFPLIFIDYCFVVRVRFLTEPHFSKHSVVLVCAAVSLGVQLPVLRRNVVLNREDYRFRRRMLDPEEGSNIFLPNVTIDSLNATATQAGRTSPRRPDISHGFVSYGHTSSPVRLCKLSSLISNSFSQGYNGRA
jgi:hypothetical protein